MSADSYLECGSAITFFRFRYDQMHTTASDILDINPNLVQIARHLQRRYQERKRVYLPCIPDLNYLIMGYVHSVKDCRYINSS